MVNAPDRPSNPWLASLPEGTPLKSWVVVALGEAGQAFLAGLPHQVGPAGAQQVVVVCCAPATHIPPMPRWVTVVPITDPELATPTEARRVGLAHAAGDVVHFVSADVLVGARVEAAAARDWPGRLALSGVGPPLEPSGRAQ